MYERLTRRESDILPLLAQNLSDHEIAERLVLSLYTVKWYTRQIYGKLGVANRREAVARAQALGLFQSEAPLKRPHHNLPRQISSFIGREKEIGEVVRLVRGHPLVTLTGAGGVGKTRLAQVVAADLVDDFPDGICYVELAALTDPLLIPVAIANALGIRVESGKQQPETLFTYFHERRALLLLDNCEHLAQASAALVHALLTRLPRLKILVTSREPLEVDGEMIYYVPSLSLPPVEKSFAIEHFDSARLFLERAKEHQIDFHLAEGQAPVLARICQRLDGIPLAIELAAARTRTLSLEQIASRLDDVFSLLTFGSRSALPRHKTLRACMDTSFQLLSPAEQLLLARLSVFGGGWSLEAAEQVCADRAENPPDAGSENWRAHEPTRKQVLRRAQILDLLSSLVDKSLVQFQVSPLEEPRYHMLETVRQYGWERLAECGETERLRSCHFAYYASRMGSLPPDDDPQIMVEWWQRLLVDLDNIRLALGWALVTDCEAGLRLCLNTIGDINLQNTPEMLNWLDRLLAGESAEMAQKGNAPRGPDRLALRGKALLYGSDWRSFWGQLQQARQAAVESKAIFESLGEPGEVGLAAALTRLGIVVMVDDPEQAQEYLETSLGYLKRHEEWHELVFCYKVLGNLFGFLGEFEQAGRSLREALRLARAYNLWGEQAMLLNMLGWNERLVGNYDQARELFIQSQAAYARAGEYDHVAGCLCDQAHLAWSQEEDEQVLRLSAELGDLGERNGSIRFSKGVETILAFREWKAGVYDQAARRAEAALAAYQPYYLSFTGDLAYILGRIALQQNRFEQAARYFLQFDDAADAPRWHWKAYSLHCFGLLAAAQITQSAGEAERAALLFGAQEALFGWLSKLFAPIEQRAYDLALAAVRQALGEENFAAAWNTGRTMPRIQVYQYARQCSLEYSV